MIHQAHLFCEKERIEADDLNLPEPEKPARPATSGNNHLKGMTRQKLTDLARKHSGVVSLIARELNITRKACYDNFARHKVDIGKFRKGV